MNRVMREETGGGDSGYTIPETLMAVAIVSLSLVLALGAAEQGTGAALRAKNALSTGVEIIAFHRALREMIGKIIVPYWGNPALPAAREHTARQDGGTTTVIPWYLGKENDTVTIRIDGGGRLSARIASGTAGDGETTEIVSPPSIEAESVEIGRSHAMLPAGLRITWAWKGRKFMTGAAFGGFPPATGGTE